MGNQTPSAARVGDEEASGTGTRLIALDARGRTSDGGEREASEQEVRGLENHVAVRAGRLSWLLGLSALGLLGAARAASMDWSRKELPTTALIVLSCGLPLFLSRLCCLLINRRASRQPAVRFILPDGLDPAIAAHVSASWKYELGRICWSLCRAESFSIIWGLVTTLLLVAGAGCAVPSVLPLVAAARSCGQAVIGAASVSFLLDLALFAIRTANDDANKRMFAEALRGLVMAVIVSTLVVLVPELFNQAGTGAARTFALGGAVAMVGMPAFDYVRQKLIELFKLGNVQPPDLTPLHLLAGVSAQEIARLGEEGIESVEALIGTPIPRLFLNTRFALPKICDWIDRSLLLTRLGADTTKKLKDATGITRASEVAREVTGGDLRLGGIVTALKRAMHLENDDNAATTAQAIAGDPRTALIQAFEATVVVPHQHAA
jgi:hypothetical protein